MDKTTKIIVLSVITALLMINLTGCAEKGTSSSYKVKNDTTSTKTFSYEDTIITKENLDTILGEITTKLNEDDLCCFYYITKKNVDTLEHMESNLYNKSIKTLISNGKAEIMKDGYTIDAIKAQIKGETTNSNKDEGKLGNYYVKIGNGKVKTTRNNKKILIVDVSFTNNSDQEVSFMSAISDRAYQDGVELDMAYSVYDYDFDSQSKRILKGTTYNVQIAFELSNTNSDIIVKLSELFSGNDINVTKVFKISQ